LKTLIRTQNGKLDAVITFNPWDNESIFASKDALQSQIPSISTKFPSNISFAEATTKDILGDDFSKSNKLSTKELRSGVFINDGDGFHFEPFPNAMQVSFIQDFLIRDFNDDGLMDIFSAGNLYASSMQEGKYAADRGSILTGQSGKRKLLSNHDTGLSLKGDVKKIEYLNFQGNEMIMVVRNNDSILWLKRR